MLNYKELLQTQFRANVAIEEIDEMDAYMVWFKAVTDYDNFKQLLKASEVGHLEEEDNSFTIFEDDLSVFFSYIRKKKIGEVI
jgi:hypothetical protein